MANICVFCGSSSGHRPEFAESAALLGQQLVDQGHCLVYGGGIVGLMGALADAVLQNGGHVIGVIPEALARVELMHPDVPDMRIVPDMHIRKATMHELADGYIALPGGFGTMEELFEVLCWAQLDFHTAPVTILNTNGYYDGLLRVIDTMISEAFLCDSYRCLLNTCDTDQELLNWLTSNFGKR